MNDGVVAGMWCDVVVNNGVVAGGRVASCDDQNIRRTVETLSVEKNAGGRKSCEGPMQQIVPSSASGCSLIDSSPL